MYTDAFVGDNSWNGRERNHYLMNRGGGDFVEIGSAVGLDSMADARGLAAADFDRDGDVDFVVNNYRALASYYVNEHGAGRGWLEVRLRGTTSNRDAIGAELTVRVGGQTMTRVVGAGHGFAGQHSLLQHFGLGSNEAVDKVTVRWPDGRVEHFDGGRSGTSLLLVEGEGHREEVVNPGGASRVPLWGRVGAWLAGAIGLALGVGTAARRARGRA